MFMKAAKTTLPSPDKTLPGRDHPLTVPDRHFIFDTPLKGPFPASSEMALFGMGCFWGVEKRFWSLPGVVSTAVGYAAGSTPNPTYEEVCTGCTGHNEVVQVVFDPGLIDYETLLMVFFEAHDPTQGMRQGNDVGTQYRSGIYTFSDEQRDLAHTVLERYQTCLKREGFGEVTTEVITAPPFYYAEGYHQQYLAKNPDGYCGLKGTGIACA